MAWLLRDYRHRRSPRTGRRDRPRARPKKAIIAIAVERLGFGKKSKRVKLGRVRMRLIPNTQRQTLEDFSAGRWSRRSRKASYIDFVSSVGNLAVGFGHEKGMEPSDAALWSRSRAGDADAFGLLFERHAKTIYNYCFRRIGDWASAEDLLSIVFLEAWRRRSKELPADKVLPWLFGIATNVVRNRRRAERRHAAVLARVPLSPVEPRFEDISDERLDDERQMQRALALLAQLPQREQDVFVLCAWMELSYDDAALALGTPVGTIRSRLSRARQRLRELDDGCGHEEGRTTTVQEALEP